MYLCIGGGMCVCLVVLAKVCQDYANLFHNFSVVSLAPCRKNNLGFALLNVRNSIVRSFDKDIAQCFQNMQFSILRSVVHAFRPEQQREIISHELLCPKAWNNRFFQFLTFSIISKVILWIRIRDRSRNAWLFVPTQWRSCGDWVPPFANIWPCFFFSFCL